MRSYTKSAQKSVYKLYSSFYVIRTKSVSDYKAKLNKHLNSQYCLKFLKKLR